MAVFAPTLPERAPMADDNEILLLRKIAAALFLIEGGSGGGATGTGFTSNPQILTSSGSIPAGILGYSFTAVSGTVTINGAALPVGATVADGGYPGRTMATAIAYTIAAGSAILITGTPA